jgi:hypothetical protein
VYLAAVDALGVDARTAVAVEDSANGIRAAVAAGTRVVAVPNRVFPPPADVVVTSLSELTRTPWSASLGRAGRRTLIGDRRRAARRNQRERDDVGMPGRPIGRRLAAWTASLAVLGAVAVAAATPAVADTPTPTPPPWVIGQLKPGEWIAYTLLPTNPQVFARNPSTLWGPVTLTRETSNNLQLSGLLASDPGWPRDWSSNGITLQRADRFCDLTAPSCQYYVTGASGQPFFFGASGGPAPGVPPPNFVDQGGLTLAQPVLPSASFVLPPSGALPSSGSFTFDGSGSHDSLPGLEYDWTLTPAQGSPIT